MDVHRTSAPLSFLAGLGAGIVVATLFAPRSGAAIRRLVSRQVERGVDRAKEVAEVISRG